jgi:serine phosphatase RsbU (regulator of sigma subunit)/anti-sigma regulatory factor (Ser/Thr protein kinase)
MAKLVPERFRRRPVRADAHAPLEYVGTAAGFRRRLAVTAIAAVVVLVAVSAGLAFQQYRHAQRSNVRDLHSRATVAAAAVDAAFSGDVATLGAVAQAPAFANLELGPMAQYLGRLGASDARTFNAGLGWVDRNGYVDVSSTGSRLRTYVGDRTYFRRVLATGRPYVSGGIVGRRVHEPVVVVAVATRTASGGISGVLAASIRLGTVRNRKAQLDLGYQGLQIVDRNGNELLSGLAPVPNRDLLARLTGASGSIASTRGLDGSPGHVVAYATAPVPAWRIVLDRSRASLNESALRSLVLQLASVGAIALLVLGLVWLVVRRSRRESELQESRARAWGALTRALGAASTVDEVAAAVVASLAAAFPDSLVVVVLDGIDGSRETHASADPGWPPIAADGALADELARRATAGRETVALERDPALRAIAIGSGRRLRCLHTQPLVAASGETVGGIALLRGSEDPLEADEHALYESFAEQTARAFERSRRSELDHDLAVRLQLSLLPDALPEVPGVELTGHYSAGAEGLVVGGDWYDAIRRRDGIVVLCVGDVIGRGVGAATLMGRLRDAFRAHAYETASPAEIVRRMIQHGSRDELMVTLACAALDPYPGELVYSCAGHPPPLVVDEDAGTVTRLDGAVAPPLGVADPAAIEEERIPLPPRATLAFYTDGLIERRGKTIDLGIDALGRVVAADPERPVPLMLQAVGEVLGPGDDDVAFLLARVAGPPTPFEVELPSSTSELSPLRRRLRAWLARRGFERAERDEILLAISEALNNSIEHAYGDARGTVWLRVDDDGETLRTTVRDRGNWRAGPSGVDRGRGLEIMRAVMDRAEVETTPEGTEVVLERRRRESHDRARV